MAKKLAVFMAIVCVGLIAFVVWSRFGADKTGPEIKFSNEELVYHDGMSHSELLQDVTAFDEKDGDVSDTLAVESVYPVEDGQVVVVYVAKDNSNNITKVKQFYAYDAGASDEEGTGADADTGINDNNDNIGVDTNNTEADMNSGTAEGTDVGPSQPAEPEGLADNANAEGTSDPSVPVSASADAEQIRKEQEEAADQMPAGAPRIYLSDYVVKVPVGTTVDRLSYVKEITDDSDNVYDLWTKIQIKGTLDTMTPGTYECTYYVVDSQGNTSNQAVVQFIVE